MRIPDQLIRSPRFQAMTEQEKLAVQRMWASEDAAIREGMRADRRGEPWCPDHGYGCEPRDCPCGHSLRCDCRDIAANEH